MKLVTLLSLTVLTSQILSQKMVFRSVKCDAKAPNLSFITKNLGSKLKILEKSVEPQEPHPCYDFYNFSGGCCDLKSLQNSIATLPKEAAQYYRAVVYTSVGVFKNIYAPFLYSQGAKILRERSLEYLALFVEKISQDELKGLLRSYIEYFNDLYKYNVDFTSDAFCLLCATDYIFQQNTMRDRNELHFGISKSFYRQATIALGKFSVLSDLFEEAFRAIRFKRATEIKKVEQEKARFEKLYAAIKLDGDQLVDYIEKHEKTAFYLLTFDLNIDSKRVYDEAVSFLPDLKRATGPLRQSQRMLQMILPDEFIPVVKHSAKSDTVGFAGRNVTKHEKIKLSADILENP